MRPPTPATGGVAAAPHAAAPSATATVPSPALPTVVPATADAKDVVAPATVHSITPTMMFSPTIVLVQIGETALQTMCSTLSPVVPISRLPYGSVPSETGPLNPKVYVTGQPSPSLSFWTATVP